MEIHQLEYFIAIVETGGFSKAAQRCHVAQPSLSQQIKKLETEIGQPLFDRLGRTVALTDAGQRLLPRARRILQELEQIQFEIQAEDQAYQGQLTVGFIPTIAPFVLPGVIRRFGQEFPQAQLEVYEGLTEELVERLVAAELDVAITSLPIHNDLIRTETLLSEPLLLAASAHNALANQATIQVRELDELPFIALSEVHCLGEQVQAFCFQEEVQPNIVCHTTQLSTVQNCVALGLGVSLVPRALAAGSELIHEAGTDRAAERKIIYRALSDALPERKIAAATHIKRNISLLARQFIDLVRAEYPGP